MILNRRSEAGDDRLSDQAGLGCRRVSGRLDFAEESLRHGSGPRPLLAGLSLPGLFCSEYGLMAWSWFVCLGLWSTCCLSLE